MLLASTNYQLNEQVCNANTVLELEALKTKLLSFKSNVAHLIDAIERKVYKIERETLRTLWAENDSRL